MLFSVDSGKYVEKMPHNSDFKSLMKNLKHDDYEKIVAALTEKIGENEVNTSSWIPGSKWEGTVYYPIYQACNDNKEEAGKFFGLILFNLLMNIKDTVWGFGKYEKNGVPIKGITYFVLSNPPEKR